MNQKSGICLCSHRNCHMDIYRSGVIVEALCVALCRSGRLCGQLFIEKRIQSECSAITLNLFGISLWIRYLRRNQLGHYFNGLPRWAGSWWTVHQSSTFWYHYANKEFFSLIYLLAIWLHFTRIRPQSESAPLRSQCRPQSSRRKVLCILFNCLCVRALDFRSATKAILSIREKVLEKEKI